MNENVVIYYLKFSLRKKREARRAAAHKDESGQVQCSLELPLSVASGNGGREAELLPEQTAHHAGRKQGLWLCRRGRMAHIFGMQQEG